MAAEPPERRPLPPPDREAMSDFDHVDRITARFLHWARPSLLVGLPVWLVLLLLVPRSGLGPMSSLALSTAVTIGVVVAVERLWGRWAAARRGSGAPAGDGPVVAGRRARKRPMSPLLAVVLTLAGVAVFVYVIFIITIIVRGG